MIKRKAAFLIIYCSPFGDSLYERFLIATRWSGSYGFIGGEINSDEEVIQGLIRECHEEIGFDLSLKKDGLELLSNNFNEIKNMDFYTFTLKINEKEIKKIWSEWRSNGKFADYEISGLSLMRTEKEIMKSFKSNNFSGNSKNELEKFIEKINKSRIEVKNG